MSFIEDLIPVYYELKRIRLRRSNGDVVAIADMNIRNANEKQIITHSPETMLTAQEKQVLGNFINRELAAFETATGLTKWEGDIP